MFVLRIALLAGALAAMPLPAAAVTDDAARGVRDSDVVSSTLEARQALAEVRAVEAVLEAATDGGDPIEQAALDGVRGFYKARGFTVLWLVDGVASPRMIELRRYLSTADEQGLDPSLYATPDLSTRRYYDAGRLAEADVAFSRSVARFVMHVASGRLQPTEISSLITLKPERPDVGEALWRLSQDADLDATIAGYEPPHPQYAALKTKLAELRALGEEEDRIVVPEGALLKPGMMDSRVPLLRERFEVEPAEETDSELHNPELYDDALVAAVEAFQEHTGLSVDGIIGPRTLFALNGRSRADDIASIIANMERWRWMPRDLGAFHVMVNVPEFSVRVVESGSIVHETRVVVGKPSNRTPTFSHTIDHVVVNPYWNVPVSIVREEMMPEIRANPYGYFERHGYQVLANVGGRMRLINPYRIDWYRVSPHAVRIRQVPGSHNALGRIKFMFPNQHSVYLHDTPSKSLFDRDHRAFSHGCVRVQNPLEFADAILPHAAPEWNSSRLESLFGGQERRVNLDNPVPVHLAYFTSIVGPDGALHHVEDIYGYDGEMTAFLGS
jgi:murein L,D-transpeptidase YcbB/YkuD